MLVTCSSSRLGDADLPPPVKDWLDQSVTGEVLGRRRWWRFESQQGLSDTHAARASFCVTRRIAASWISSCAKWTCRRPACD
jgi:hypothetical protein